MNIPEFSTKNSLLVNLISAFILLAGFAAMMNLNREAFPPVDFDIVTISASYPGAPPEDVEKFVTIPIEKELKGISGIKEMQSTSEEGQSTIGITLDPAARDKDQIVDDIKTAVDRVKDLPEGVEEDPLVFELKSKERPVIEISLSGDYPESTLRQYAESLEDQLLDIEGVASVRRVAWRDREFWVEVDPQKLQEYHVSLDEIFAALRSRNITLPGGQLTTPDLEYDIRITAEFLTPAEVEEVVIRANDAGNWLKVKDVARVIDTYEDETRIPKVNKNRAVAMVVVKSEEGDAIQVVDSVNKTMEEFKQTLHPGMEITVANDLSYYIKRRLNVLKNNGIVGYLLVLVILFLFLDPVPAFMTALGVPMALFTTFIVMLMMGININLISMLGLIIVLGMLVDDGIIVSENTYRYIEKGLSPREAAVRGAGEVMAPVMGTILTTIAAFVPLLFMKDIIGKFIKEIPLVVIVALCASVLEAFIILPAHLADFIKVHREHSQATPPHKEKKWFKTLVTFYSKVLNGALNHRYKVAVVLLGVLVATVLIWKFHIKMILFTGEGIEWFFIRAEAKTGTPLEKMNELIAPVEDLVAGLPKSELDSFRTYLGSIESERGFDPTARQGTHLGQITVFLTPFQQRHRKPQEIADGLREKLKDIPGFERLYVFLPREGPPVGQPISVGIKGEEYPVLLEISHQFMETLKSMPGASDLETSYQFGKKQLKVVIDEQKAQKYYLTVGQIASSVRSAFRGAVTTSIKPLEAEEEINVVVRFRKDERSHLNAFEQILISNRFNNLVPLKSVAEIKEEEGIYQISHLDGKRVVYVTADVDNRKTTSLNVNTTLQKKFKDISDKYLGYTVKYSGEYEKQQESQQNLMISFLLAFFFIFIVLTAQFQSLLQPVIILMSIPYGLIGVVWAFLLHGRPLSFFALMGLVGLTGVVVNDSIVLLDFINRLRKSGKPRRESLLEAGQTRLRPILMTSLTTIGGLISVAYGIGGGDPFLKPMALAIVWGLFFASSMNLMVTPCLYAIVDDFSEKVFHHATVKVNNHLKRAVEFDETPA